ncbi:hypothetical protein ABIB62_002354 [Mucilaginibacter sp. UYP25]|uniref:hypothetical protein n=1 Tax=unclassified Mucilaginibacter TaxID=2617802 RepID=UPI00339B538B
MENQERIEHLEQLLTEAMELLADNRLMLAMFNKGYYFKLKAKVAALDSSDKNNNEFL